MITRSCRKPLTAKVSTMANAEGTTTRSRGKTQRPSPYPQIGFQCLQNPASELAPSKRASEHIPEGVLVTERDAGPFLHILRQIQALPHITLLALFFSPIQRPQMGRLRIVCI